MKLLKSKRFVLHLHNDSLNEDTLHSKSIIQSYSRIITVSNYIKSRVLAINPELEDRISVVLNGIDLDKFHHFHQTKITRQTLGLRTDERVIIYFGRTIAEKGFHVLLESFRKIETENCCLLIIGSNWYGSAERESIDTSIFEDASKKKRVIFTGYIDYDLVPKYLSVGDIAVLPSIWEEPAGLVIIEALASGLPTITTISGGIPEYTSTNLSVLINRDNHLSDNISRAIDIMFQNDKKLANLSSLGIMHSMKFSKQIFYTNFVKAMMNE
jgi:glycosyltransferase involved in cell wall biosynthesis